MNNLQLDVHFSRRAIRIFALFNPVQFLVADLFFDRLRLEDESIGPFSLPKIELERQFDVFLSFVMSALLQADLHPVIFQTLGAKHQKAGIRVAHYEASKRAFLWVIKEGIGDLLDNIDFAALDHVCDFAITQLCAGRDAKFLRVMGD